MGIANKQEAEQAIEEVCKWLRTIHNPEHAYHESDPQWTTEDYQAGDELKDDGIIVLLWVEETIAREFAIELLIAGRVNGLGGCPLCQG